MSDNLNTGVADSGGSVEQPGAPDSTDPIEQPDMSNEDAEHGKQQEPDERPLFEKLGCESEEDLEKRFLGYKESGVEASRKITELGQSNKLTAENNAAMKALLDKMNEANAATPEELEAIRQQKVELLSKDPDKYIENLISNRIAQDNESSIAHGARMKDVYSAATQSLKGNPELAKHLSPEVEKEMQRIMKNDPLVKKQLNMLTADNLKNVNVGNKELQNYANGLHSSVCRMAIANVHMRSGGDVAAKAKRDAKENAARKNRLNTAKGGAGRQMAGSAGKPGTAQERHDAISVAANLQFGRH